MKSSTIMAIALCGVLACAVTGCKYDDEAPIPENGDFLIFSIAGIKVAPSD